MSSTSALTISSWALVIIAVVLAGLFALGVFNTSNFAPRATPGSCYIYRPNGPLSAAGIALTGTCSGALPEYVATFASASSQYAAIPNSGTFYPSAVTVTAWVYMAGNPSASQIVAGNTAESSGGWLMWMDPSYVVRFGVYTSSWVNGGTAANLFGASAWHQISATWDGSNFRIYVDGALKAGPIAASGTMSNNAQPLDIGRFLTGVDYFNGQMSNIQVYNTSLSANDINALYLEGIGGAPLVLQNLVGWWPLNQNVNDYSGNVNNATSSSNSYTGTISGYTAS